MSLKVLVTVGTDHHPFDRVIQWVEAWSRRQPAPAVEVYMQTGTSRPPEATKSTEYLDFDDLMERIGEADAVISHGGPSTISHCLRLGVMPIVVPREHDRGEHVDDHQVAFSTKMAEDQGFEIARTEAQLDELLDQALTDPGRFRHAQTHNELESSVERFVDVIDGLLDPAARRHGWPDRLPRRPLAAPDRTDGWRVLYVGGWGRSGSTLLDRMLGQVPKVISVGEVREIFQRGCVENRLCGCGVHFLDCSFWSAVGDRAFGGWSKVDSEDVVAAWRRVDRPWVAPALVGPRLPTRLAREVDAYTDILARLYGAIAAVSEGSLIVDSSKLPSYALLLDRALPGRVRAVHLVRDSRGVVFSWQKQVARTDGGGDSMHRYGALAAAVRYDVYNGTAQLLDRAGVPTIRARYEDLVADPVGAISDMLDFSGHAVPAEQLDYLRGDTVQLAANHSVDGNPMRFDTGAVPLRVDDAWRRGMSRVDRTLVSVATAPLLLRYGYVARTGRRRSS